MPSGGRMNGLLLREKTTESGRSPNTGEAIFGIFKRLQGNSFPGTGIGLAICERIVKSYGGQIWVESVPGAGSIFYFTLPDLPQSQFAEAIEESRI